MYEPIYHEVPSGLRNRISFSKINEILEMPDLIEVQRHSYRQFLETGLREVLRDISPIIDYTDTLSLELFDYRIEQEPKYTVEECKERDVTYSAPLKVKVRLTNRTTGEIKEQEVFMGEFPIMTENGTFIINGAERVIVSQLVRSPGVIFEENVDKNGRTLINTTIIPNRGAWLEFESDSNDVLWTRVDRTRKLPATVLLRALGCGTDTQLQELFGEDEKLLATLERDSTKTQKAGLLEIYKRLRPGEPPTVESAQSLLTALFFDARRYDLARVGRYKINKKLHFNRRLVGQKVASDVVNPRTGEIIVAAGETVTLNLANEIQNAGVHLVDLAMESRTVRCVSNMFVDPAVYLEPLGLDAQELELNENVHYPTLVEILDEHENDEDTDELAAAIKAAHNQLIPKHIYTDDVMAAFSYLLGTYHGLGTTDDIDHLGNRRLRSVGELLQNQIRIGLARLERVVKERMAIQDQENLTPQALINIRPVSAAIKEFFGSSQLSHFMDQTNPLAELTNKRRLSALGPGGLNRDRATFDVRDIHHSHYGRICPIETPEGPNIGLIGSLAIYARVNPYGFIETPYRRVDKANCAVTQEIEYMTADEEDQYIIAQANEETDENGRFVHEMVSVRAYGEIVEVRREMVDYMDVSPKQLVAVSTAMIPFLENDDANRALMGTNMQRQAVPLLKPEAPFIGTGMEYKCARDSGVLILAKNAGVVEKVSADEIIVRTEDGRIDEYHLLKFTRSNQGTCINQRPIVSAGQVIRKGQELADGPATDGGEVSLGRNILIGFMGWEGYNYEDAILINERLVREDVFTSIHIEEYECEARDTKLGPEEITREIPNVGEDAIKDLDERGIIRVGAEVRSGDILVGKVTPKGETELNAEERLLRAIFGEKVREVRDTSLRVPHGEAGIIVDVKIFTRENHDDLSPGVNETIRVYIAQRRKISVGDKMSGRHGNKGVVSRIMPEEDMPFLEDGTPLQIVLNPLGVPSRLNIGQVLEVHLGMIAKMNGWHIATPVFDGANEKDIKYFWEELHHGKNMTTLQEKFHLSEDTALDLMANGLTDQVRAKIKADLPDAPEYIYQQALAASRVSRNGKFTLYDGRTGLPFDNPVTVGYMYMLKLHHLVDDKIHARSTGPYSLVTQQPLGGKAQFGGQRFGEMEVWALEAYGAAHTLQEILTVKSDDVVGRVKAYEAIVKGENIPEPSVPEAFKVLVKELQSLALDVKVLDENQHEIELKDTEEEDARMADLGVNLEGEEGQTGAPVETSDYESEDGFDDTDLELDDLDSLPALDDLDEDMLDFGDDLDIR